jgi:hypothetical protein
MNVVMLGLPRTGKTTYAVGLHAGAANGAFETLKIVSTDDPVAALNRGFERLAMRMPVERTETEVTEPIGLTVEIEGGETHKLRIPDRSGEALRGALHGRQWHPELLEELEAAEGLILFVSPLTIRPGIGAEEVGEMIAPGNEVADEEISWSPSMMPTDAAMVDALQEIGDATGRRSIPVAVVISAWDMVEAPKKPQGWLEENVPLLAQYLASDNSVEVGVFGVSVQGGPFADAGEETIDPGEPDPWERARCVDAAGRQAELSAPLVWLLRAGG